MSFAQMHNDWLDPDRHDLSIEEPDIDPLEELQALDSDQTEAEAVSQVAPQPTEFDLDALLADSLILAEARKRKAQGRRLSAEDAEVLEVARRTLDWSPVAQVAVFRVTRCSCGHESRTLQGWYSVLRHRREATTRRLTLETGRSPGIPAFTYAIAEAVEECPACLADIPEATFSEIEQWNLRPSGKWIFPRRFLPLWPKRTAGSYASPRNLGIPGRNLDAGYSRLPLPKGSCCPGS